MRRSLFLYPSSSAHENWIVEVLNTVAPGINKLPKPVLWYDGCLDGQDFLKKFSDSFGGFVNYCWIVLDVEVVCI